MKTIFEKSVTVPAVSINNIILVTVKLVHSKKSNISIILYEYPCFDKITYISKHFYNKDFTNKTKKFKTFHVAKFTENHKGYNTPHVIKGGNINDSIMLAVAKYKEIELTLSENIHEYIKDATESEIDEFYK